MSNKTQAYRCSLCKSVWQRNSVFVNCVLFQSPDQRTHLHTHTLLLLFLITRIVLVLGHVTPYLHNLHLHRWVTHSRCCWRTGTRNKGALDLPVNKAALRRTLLRARGIAECINAGYQTDITLKVHHWTHTDSTASHPRNSCQNKSPTLFFFSRIKRAR